HQFISSPTHQFTNSPIHQFTNSPIYQIINSSIHQISTRNEVERNEVKSTPETKSNGTKLNQRISASFNSRNILMMVWLSILKSSLVNSCVAILALNSHTSKRSIKGMA